MAIWWKRQVHSAYFLGRLLVAGAIWIVSLSVAQAQSSSPGPGGAMDQYATLAGAWYLNKKCDHLSEIEAQTFENQLAQITVWFSQDHGFPIAQQLQAAGKRVAVSKGYDCGQKTEEIVRDSIEVRHRLHMYLSTITRFDNLMVLGRALGGAERCLGTEHGQTKELQGTYNMYLEKLEPQLARSEVQTWLKDHNVAHMISTVQKYGEEHRAGGRAGPNPPCGDKLEAFNALVKDMAVRNIERISQGR